MADYMIRDAEGQPSPFTYIVIDRGGKPAACVYGGSWQVTLPVCPTSFHSAGALFCSIFSQMKLAFVISATGVESAGIHVSCTVCICCRCGRLAASLEYRAMCRRHKNLHTYAGSPTRAFRDF